MSNFKLILFDLDGTLIDSQSGIINSIRHALDKLGLPPKGEDELVSFIGPPLLDSFTKRCNLDEELAWEAIHLYREYYSRRGMYECTVYEGLPAMLQILNRYPMKLAVATSKATYYAEKILTHLGLAKHFSLVMGSNLDGTRAHKSEVIACALQEAGDGTGENRHTIMVGDRKYDVLGARANKISSVAVTYGFGGRKELAAAEPDYIVSSVGELTRLLLDKN